MATPETHEHAPKSLGEGAVCFGSAVIVLLAAALVIEWLLHLLP